MRKLLALLVLAVALPALPSCSTPPAERVAQVQTLKAVGITAKAAIDTAAILLRNGKITVPQFQAVAHVYDDQFQPAFAIAIKAVQSDLSPASPELTQLASDLAALVATYSR